MRGGRWLQAIFLEESLWDSSLKLNAACGGRRRGGRWLQAIFLEESLLDSSLN